VVRKRAAEIPGSTGVSDGIRAVAVPRPHPRRSAPRASDSDPSVQDAWLVRSTSGPWVHSLPTTLPQFRHVAAWSAASARYRRATASGERGVTGVTGQGRSVLSGVGIGCLPGVVRRQCVAALDRLDEPEPDPSIGTWPRRTAA